MTRAPLRFHLMWDGDAAAPELMLAATADELAALGEHLCVASGTILLQAAPAIARAWARELGWLRVERRDDGPDLLDIAIDSNALHIAGTSTAVRNLGESLVAFFGDGAGAGAHLHLDEASGLAAPGSCGLVIGVPRLS